MAGQKARSAVFAPEVPAIHVLWRRVKRESEWMPGHQGVYARLRRAMPGHDGADGCHDAFVARRLFGARSRMSRKSGYRFSEKDMRQRKIGSRTAAIHVHHCMSDGGRPAIPRSRVPGSAEILSVGFCVARQCHRKVNATRFFFDRNCPGIPHASDRASLSTRAVRSAAPSPLRDNEAQCNPLNGQGKPESVSASVSLSRLRFHTAA